MSVLKIAEAWTVQFPMVKHASEIGWTALTPDEAEGLRRGTANMVFTDVLEGDRVEAGSRRNRH